MSRKDPRRDNTDPSNRPLRGDGGRTPMVVGRPVQGQPPQQPTTGWAVPAYTRSRFPGEETPCRDIFWTIFFWLHLAAAIGLAGYALTSDAGKDFMDNGISFCDPMKSTCNNPSVGKVVASIWLSAGLAFGLAFLWSLWVRSCAKCVIWFMIITNLVLMIASFALGIYYMNSTIGRVILGILAILMIGLYVFWIFLVRRRIAFTVALVETAMECASSYWGTYVSTAIAIVPIVAFAVMMAYAAGAASEMLYSRKYKDQQVVGAVTYFYMLFSYLWTMQVIANVVLTIISGVVARYLFLGDGTNAVDNDQHPGRSKSTDLNH